MATTEQITANRLNSQQSTGPVTEEGQANSSQNSTKHGYTGKTLVLSAGEVEPYNAHVDNYYKEFKPATERQSDLLQELADLRWSLHQIFTEESKIMAFMAEATTAAEMVVLTRTLNTLGTYEARRRRAAKAVEQDLIALQKADFEKQSAQMAQAVPLYQSYTAQGKTFDPEKFGFDCSIPQILDFIEGQQAAIDLYGPRAKAVNPAGARK